METHYFKQEFQIGDMIVQPVHVRIEQLRPFIAAHRHSHSSYEIHYTARGRGTVRVEGKTYLVKENTLYITGPDISHEQCSEQDDPILEYCLYLNCRQRKKKKDGKERYVQSFLDTKFWIGEDLEHVYEAMGDLIQERREDSIGMEEMSEAILRRIIILLTRSYIDKRPEKDTGKMISTVTSGEHYPLIEDAFFYNYRTLRLADLAQILHLSERQTQRFLQEHYGKTFSQKLTDARMSAALQILTNSEKTIENIAEEIGYSSGEHFSTAFRRYYQCPPSIYRKRYYQTKDTFTFSSIHPDSRRD